MSQDPRAERRLNLAVLWCLECGGGSGEGGDVYDDGGHDDEAVSYHHSSWGRFCLKQVQKDHWSPVYAHWFVPLCGYESERVSDQDCLVYGHGQVFPYEYCPGHDHDRVHVNDHASVHGCYVCDHDQLFESECCHARVWAHGHDSGHHSVHEACSLQ